MQAYLSEDIRRELGLHREELVALAYFLGCDYTDGVTGVGIVNALEIVQAFPMRHQSDSIIGNNNVNDINSVDNMISIDSSSNNRIDDHQNSNANGNQQNIDKHGHGHYPVVGLLKFKDWLEGYDFRETIIAQKSKSKSKLKSKGLNLDKKSDAESNQKSKKVKNRIRRKQSSKMIKKRKFDDDSNSENERKNDEKYSKEYSSHSDFESDSGADEEDLFTLSKLDRLKRKTNNEKNKNESKKKDTEECGIESENDCETSSDNEDDSTGVNNADHDCDPQNSNITSENHGSEEQNTDSAPDLATRLVKDFLLYKMYLMILAGYKSISQHL